VSSQQTPPSKNTSPDGNESNERTLCSQILQDSHIGFHIPRHDFLAVQEKRDFVQSRLLRERALSGTGFFLPPEMHRAIRTIAIRSNCGAGQKNNTNCKCLVGDQKDGAKSRHKMMPNFPSITLAEQESKNTTAALFIIAYKYKTREERFDSNL
jgi:hypothetical protein